jgi:peptidoglycan/xylan/chitin deacetylase (PgdA/CDA1 family)
LARIWLCILLGLLSTSYPGFTACACDFARREGFVSLEFDDSPAYDRDYIEPMLTQHGFRGTFAIVTEVSALGIYGDAGAVTQMYLHGHEIQDHTTRHDYMWATHVDTLDDGVTDCIEYTFGNLAIWDSLCDRSLFILDSLGVRVSGWNHPGGGTRGNIPGHPEWAWYGLVNDSLYALIASRYDYIVGCGVYPPTAHLNLRGHNWPDRYPVFNVTHRTLDNLSIQEIKEGVADAVASGLWYPAVTHTRDYARVCKVTELVEWIDDNDIPVLTVGEGVDRIICGHPDPLANQLPQAVMLKDLDGNARPDGFAGSCTWDTVTVPPVDGVHCLRVSGQCDFCCYGPEVGLNAFSIWAKAIAGGTFRVGWEIPDFEWNLIGSGGTGWITVGDSWTRVDNDVLPGLNVEVEPEADRVRFILITPTGNSVLFAYPEFTLLAEAGASSESKPSPLVLPNPVMRGQAVQVPGAEVLIFDVCGRCCCEACRRLANGITEIETAGLAPGVYFVTAREAAQCANGAGATKIVVLE